MTNHPRPGQHTIGDLFAFADGRFRIERFIAGEFVVLIEESTKAERRLPLERLNELLEDGLVVRVPSGYSGAHMTLNLKRDEVLRFPTGKFRFSRELSNRVLLLQDEATGLEMQIAEERLVKLLGEGAVERDEMLADETGRLQHSNENDDIAPGEEGSERVLRARSFKFYVEKWDEDISIGKGKKALGDLIARHRQVARQKGFTWDVKPARLKAAIDGCGMPGLRPLRLFLSRRGRTKRNRIPVALEALMSRAVKFYWSERKRDFNDTFAYLRQLIREENVERQGAGREVIITPSRMETLRRRINAAECHLTWSQKYSKFEADQRFRGTSDSLKAERPGELVIMDHTVMDNWVLFDDINRIPLGRLTLTVAIDVATRCILGFLISAEPASLYSVLTVLKRVNKEKSYVNKLYPAIQGTWDSWCHVEELLVDNGWEFLSPSFQDALADLGTKVKWAPVKTPAYKAIGERFFHTLNTLMIHKLPNSVPHDPKLMSALRLDPQKDMVISISDLDRLMHQCVIEVYEQETHSGLRAIPARIWQEKIARHRRRFISDVKRIDELLGRVDEAQLTRSGVKFKNMVFHDQSAVTEVIEDMISSQKKRDQPIRTHQSARIKVKIKWNPEDCTKIQVYNSGASPKHYVTLYNVDERFSEGMSFWHAEQVYKFAKDQDLAYRSDDEKWAARNRLREEWEKLIPARPRRNGADARRALAQEAPRLETGLIEEVFAKPRLDGSGEATGIANSLPAFDRLDDEQIPQGARRGGRAATQKAAETRRRKQAADQNKWAEDTSADQERPASGKPSPTGIAGYDDIMKRVNWGK
jgi:putative transposase